MKPDTAFPSFILLAVLATHPAYGQQQDGADDAQVAIRTLIQRAVEANNAGAVEAWVDLFAHDAVYMAPGAPSVTTRAGLLEVARAGFRHQASIDIEPLEIQILGDWAFARTRVSGSVRLQGTGEVVSVDVKEIVIYRRGEDGDWKIARLISNSNRE
jgi:uncharacterized protein (TIGR02246 family)